LKTDELHTELVEVAIAAGVGFLNLDPELLEGQRLAHQCGLDLLVATGFEVIEQTDAPFRLVIGKVHFESAGAHHMADGENEIIVDYGEASAEVADDILKLHGIGAWCGPFQPNNVRDFG
jgi:hypothetical protein